MPIDHHNNLGNIDKLMHHQLNSFEPQGNNHQNQ